MFTVIKKISALCSPAERRRIYIQFVLLVVMNLIDMVGIASILPFMAVVSKPEVTRTNKWLRYAYDTFHFSSTNSFLFFAGLLVLGLLVFSNLFKMFNTWYTLKYDNLLNYNMARRLLGSYMGRPYEFFLNMNTAEMSKNILIEASTVVGGILSPGMGELSNALLCILILSLLMAINPLVALAIALVLGGSYATIYLKVRHRLATIGNEQIEANAMKYMAAAEALSGIKELKVLGRERVFLERFETQALRHSEHNTTVGVISQLPRFALETIAFGGILTIVLYSLESNQDVGTIVPILATYAFAGYRLMPALQQLFANISKLRVSMPALENLFIYMTQGWAVSGPDFLLTDNQDQRPLPFTSELVLKNITFRYLNAQALSINGIDLTIKPNTTIGLVGSTGSGKTTTIDIILGLLHPTSGQLLVDGIEINSSNLSRWQRNLGYVPQSIYLSDDTFTRNIAFGVPDREIDKNAVIQAARIANLHDFIEKDLPDGYETRIGEHGIRLSGGQRQRIGIARALYSDPAVLIMDEATSALDGVTEEAVMEALNTLSGKKTVILIAHRLTTVKNCDTIYILEKGRIVDQGTFEELLVSSPWFHAASRAGT